MIAGDDNNTLVFNYPGLGPIALPATHLIQFGLVGQRLQVAKT